MKLPQISPCDRETFILDQIRSKKVLHLGCADWPYTVDRLNTNTLLHQKMLGAAKVLVGVDLEGEGIRLLQDAGISNVLTCNSEDSLFDVLQQTFDVIVAGEIIEHVINPGLFLESIKSVCHENSVVIITTVNFAPIKRFPRLLFRTEAVHPDHIYYFSFSTLSCLLSKCGYKVEEWATHWWDNGILSKTANKILRRIPILQYYADNFCLVCRPITVQETENEPAALEKEREPLLER